ncbi:RNA-directed DNA polymerase from mobile element jockey [Trichonephila clavipes]|nr:RNA-directed DNA polymerase from mobile element jockey [Trichonephila clavipes]
MVWAGIMINGRTRLHVVANGTMTGQRYNDEVLLPHVRLFRGAVGDKFVFMDDNATYLNPIENVWDALGRQIAGLSYLPTNKNTLIRALTEEWDKLPQQLLDNVVQSMDALGRRVAQRAISHSTVQELKTTSREERGNSSLVLLNCLLKSMENRCKMCISVSGQHTKRKLSLPERLNDFLERNNILTPEQHGFRPRLSTSYQLLRVVEYIKDAIDRNQYTAAVFLDIQKAFDRVWHTGLLFKLIKYKIPPPLILLLKSYINDRTFMVKINRTYSQIKSAKAGIAQCSILGPVLFNLYVNDITKSTNTMICMYADDTAILSRHYDPNTLIKNLNDHLAHLEKWFSIWKIALNTSKTEAVSFSQKRPPPEITLQNQRILWSQHTKYLGVIIDKNLTFRQHITHIRNKFKNASRQLYSLIGRKSKLNRHNKMLIYTLILKPLLTYASPIWAHAARTNINLIESSQNAILRQILDAHWYMGNADIRTSCNIPTIRQTIRKIAISFFSNIDGHDNPTIQAISTYPTYPFIRRPRDILVDPDFN